MLDVTSERCGGLDIHQQRVIAWLMVPGHQETRTFGTMTADLLWLADWLTEQRVTHVALEPTGRDGKPVWNRLAGNFALLLATPRHLKAVPGRQPAVADAECLADLLRHGLLRGSYVPDRAQRELRGLTRSRTALARPQPGTVRGSELEQALVEAVASAGRRGEPGRPLGHEEAENCGVRVRGHAWQRSTRALPNPRHRVPPVR